MTSSLAKSKQVIGAQFQTLFSTVFLLFDVPEYSNTFDYIKDTRPADYFNNQKSLHIIFKAVCFNFVVIGMNRLTPFCYFRSTVIFLFCNPWFFLRYRRYINNLLTYLHSTAMQPNNTCKIVIMTDVLFVVSCCRPTTLLGCFCFTLRNTTKLASTLIARVNWIHMQNMLVACCLLLHCKILPLS